MATLTELLRAQQGQMREQDHWLKEQMLFQQQQLAGQQALIYSYGLFCCGLGSYGGAAGPHI